MTELAGISYPVSAEAHARLLACIQQELAGAPLLQRAEAPLLAGLGGTASVLVWLRMGMSGESMGDPHGAHVSLDWIEDLIAALAVQTRDEVLARPNLDPLRADIIYAGAVIIAELLRHYRASEFMLLDRGLRYGLLLAG